MTFDPTAPIIAVDGGGTHCRFVLAQGDQRITAKAGAANASSDFSATVQALKDGLSQLAKEADCTLMELAEIPVYLGLAGVISADIAQRIGAALPFVHCQIEDDRPAALCGALGDRDGAIAHCGTGSFLASLISGQRRIIGGWGPVLGDEASAQWLGRCALSACLEVEDGTRPASRLSHELLSHFGTTSDIVAFAAQATPAEMGALAPRITAAADRQDPLARALLKAGAQEIAKRLPQIGWTPQMPLCLTGGLATQYRDDLPTEMQAQIAPPAGPPLDGALTLARKFARHRAQQGPQSS